MLVTLKQCCMASQNHKQRHLGKGLNHCITITIVRQHNAAKLQLLGAIVQCSTKQMPTNGTFHSKMFAPPYVTCDTASPVAPAAWDCHAVCENQLNVKSR